MKSKFSPGDRGLVRIARPGLSSHSSSKISVSKGIQRTEAGTVFSYLPVKVGERFSEEKAASQAIKALFATGFFKDVRLEVENDVIVVLVDERPAISQIDFVGIKEFERTPSRRGSRRSGSPNPASSTAPCSSAPNRSSNASICPRASTASDHHHVTPSSATASA